MRRSSVGLFVVGVFLTAITTIAYADDAKDEALLLGFHRLRRSSTARSARRINSQAQPAIAAAPPSVMT